MKNLLKLSAVAISLIASANAFAASWYGSFVYTDDSLYFFDADTVEKTRDKNVLVWVKELNIRKADRDGSWGRAIRWKLNCTKRTIRVMSWSTYDEEGNFIRHGLGGKEEPEVAPDSTGEFILKMACEPNFPNDKSGKNYFKIKSNDIYQARKNFLESQNSQIDSAPK